MQGCKGRCRFRQGGPEGRDLSRRDHLPGLTGSRQRREETLRLVHTAAARHCHFPTRHHRKSKFGDEEKKRKKKHIDVKKKKPQQARDSDKHKLYYLATAFEQLLCLFREVVHDSSEASLERPVANLVSFSGLPEERAFCSMRQIVLGKRCSKVVGIRTQLINVNPQGRLARSSSPFPSLSALPDQVLEDVYLISASVFLQ